MEVLETRISPFFTGTQTPQTLSLGCLAAVRAGHAAQTQTHLVSVYFTSLSDHKNS